MKLTLIICTYKRSKVITNLLDSVAIQTLYPDEVLIIDGSPDDLTKEVLIAQSYKNLLYFKVAPKNRGLTKQRNFGIKCADFTSDIIAFLDDDTVLNKNYFEQLVEIYKENPYVTGVGGVAINENRWKHKEESKKYNKNKYYQLEDYVFKESLRNVVRNKLGLASNLLPGKMPLYSHGRTCGYPLTGKIYQADLLIGMSMSFRKIVVENIKFSSYFEGYGLYEDADFSVRALKFGTNVIATSVQLNHFHNAAGRPNKYVYGKMVVRNGWYVWRVKNAKPEFKDWLKWHGITGLLIFIRMTNILTSSEKKEAFTETVGRIVGWICLIFNKPKIQR
jgi:GT2 family glycosyltransferase